MNMSDSEPPSKRARITEERECEPNCSCKMGYRTFHPLEKSLDSAININTTFCKVLQEINELECCLENSINANRELTTRLRVSEVSDMLNDAVEMAIMRYGLKRSEDEVVDKNDSKDIETVSVKTSARNELFHNDTEAVGYDDLLESALKATIENIGLCVSQ